MLKRRIISFVIVCLLILTGCSNVRFTTGLNRNQFAKIAGQTVSMDIARLLLAEYKYSYETMFDGAVWEKEIDGVTTEVFVKNSVRDTIESIVYVGNMARELKIEITGDEELRIKDAAKEYMESVNNESKDYTKEAVEEFYRALLLAEKGFYAVTDSVDTTVSTDEARMIQVQYMYFATVKYDENGDKVELSQAEKQLQEEKGRMVLAELSEGKEFNSLAVEYSDDIEYSLLLTRGEHCAEFEEAAFKLELGETSGLVESPYGYYIIKCINYNMDSDYDSQCEKIILARRKTVFTEQYLEYADGKSTEYNDRFWEDTPVDKLNSGSGKLYDIYGKYIDISE